MSDVIDAGYRDPFTCPCGISEEARRGIFSVMKKENKCTFFVGFVTERNEDVTSWEIWHPANTKEDVADLIARFAKNHPQQEQKEDL